MSDQPFVAIVDYGLGNLFSVKHACLKVNLRAEITSSEEDIETADAVILPGVGAFQKAMNSLGELGLVDTLKNVPESGRPLVGICLGIQLMMEKSYEFGEYEGLGLVDGDVVRFEQPSENRRELPVPQVGWNNIQRSSDGGSAVQESPILDGINDDSFLYFVHSYYVRPEDESVITSTSRYGDIEFCSSLRKDNVFGFQFHPEKSGTVGLSMYENLNKYLQQGDLS